MKLQKDLKRSFAHFVSCFFSACIDIKINKKEKCFLPTLTFKKEKIK